MKKVAGNQHLLRRGGVYYYRRRGPLHLVQEFGKQFVQHSLNTTSFAQAKKLRTLKDLEWDARFEVLEKGATPSPESPNPPENEREKAEMRMEAKLDAQIARDRDNPQIHQWIYVTGQQVLQATGKSFDDPDVPHAAFAEWIRRGLLELDKRSLARLDDDHRHAFFDQLFNPSRPPKVSFGELAEQYMLLTEEEAVTIDHEVEGRTRRLSDPKGWAAGRLLVSCHPVGTYECGKCGILFRRQ
jgi:hypothetical protein